jgi:DNA repair exonuclease SbcCD nuclease subunit
VGELLGARHASKSPLKNLTQAQELFLLTHPFSQVFLGHVHEHQELILEKRLFHIVGSPQMQTHDLKGLDPNRKRHGYYILDDNNAPQFFECQSAPKFVTVYASEIKSPTKDTQKKLESLKGCIIKRCYDCALTDAEQKAFDSAITDNAPLEEDSAVFMDAATESSVGPAAMGADEMENLMNMSKEDYLKQVSENLVKESLQGQTVPEGELEKKSAALFNKLLTYYDMVKG